MRLATIFGPVAIGMDASYDRFVPASRLDQARPPFWRQDEPKNIGDWFITKATERILDFDELVILKPDAPQAAFDEVNATCNAVVLKGGNYIHRNGLLRRFVGLSVLERLTIPIIMFGSGVQAGLDEAVQFEQEDIAIFQRIHDSGGISCVRGWSAADALASIGVDSSLVTGCPTLFWNRAADLRLRPPADGAAVFTFRDGLFTTDASAYAAQFKAIDRVRALFGEVTIALQGEEVDLQDLFQVRQWGAEYGGQVVPATTDGLLRLVRTPLDEDRLRDAVHARYGPYTSGATLEWVIEHSFFSWDIVDYLDLVRSVDMVIGCRFHGNLLSLANGTPAFYLTYDSRTDELVDLLKLPSARLPDLPDDFDPRDADWSGLGSRYAELFDVMVDCLERNGLRHHLEARCAPDDLDALAVTSDG